MCYKPHLDATHSAQPAAQGSNKEKVSQGWQQDGRQENKPTTAAMLGASCRPHWHCMEVGATGGTAMVDLQCSAVLAAAAAGAAAQLTRHSPLAVRAVVAVDACLVEGALADLALGHLSCRVGCVPA